MSFLTDPNGAPLSQQIDPGFLASLAFEIYAQQADIYAGENDLVRYAEASLNAAKIFIQTNASYKP